MKTIPVSKLKASLSRYLDQVKGGAEILVTEHGRPVAKLVPVRRASVPTALADMERRGLIKVGSGRLLKDFWAGTRRRDPQGKALDFLIEER